MNLEIQRSQYIRPKVTVHKGAETIQGRKLYEEIRYYIHYNLDLEILVKNAVFQTKSDLNKGYDFFNLVYKNIVLKDKPMH